jgi:hypothetical protein
MDGKHFIRVQNKLINLNSIAYVDFLESGRAMIFVKGLSQEKQHIPLDPEDARKLRSLLDSRIAD